MTELVHRDLVDADGRVQTGVGARAVIEQVGNGILLLLAVEGRVRGLRQVIVDQPVCVLTRPTLQGALRIAEVHHHAGVGRRLGLARDFFALVVVQGLAQWRSCAEQVCREAFQGGSGRRSGWFDQHHEDELRPSKMLTAEQTPAPSMRSQYQCPGNARSLPLGGRA